MSKRQTSERKRRCCCRAIGRIIDPGFFRALADPNRIAILTQVASCRGEYTVSKVARCCPTDVSVVSRHLAALREAGILAATKRGKEVYYSVRYPQIAGALRAVADAIEACCPTEETHK